MVIFPENNIALVVSKLSLVKQEINNNSIGSILRSVRLEQNLTLNEIDADCCIAYLSKLERNMIDNPDVKIMKQVCKQLNLDYDKAVLASDGTLLYDLLQALCIMDYNKIIKLYKMLDDNIPYTLRLLIEIVYRYINKDDKEMYELIYKFDEIKHTTGKLEFAIFLIIYIFHFVRSFQLNKAIEFLDYLKLLDIDNKFVKCIYYENMFLVSSVVDSKNMDRYYNNLKEYYDYFYPLNKKNMMRMVYARSVESSVGMEILKYMEEDGIDKKNNDYLYSLAFINIKLANYKDVLNQYINNNISSYKDLAIYAYALLKLYKLARLNKNEIKNHINNIKEYISTIECEDDDLIHYYFVNFVLFVIEDSMSSFLITYIKDDLLKNVFNVYTFPLYLNCIIEEFICLIGDTGKYKEAYLLLQYMNKY